RHTSSTRDWSSDVCSSDLQPVVIEKQVAISGSKADDVVIALGPAFADGLRTTIGGLAHQDVLEALIEGVRDAGAAPRLVRVRRRSEERRVGRESTARPASA